MVGRRGRGTTAKRYRRYRGGETGGAREKENPSLPRNAPRSSARKPVLTSRRQVCVCVQQNVRMCACGVCVHAVCVRVCAKCVCAVCGRCSSPESKALSRYSIAAAPQPQNCVAGCPQADFSGGDAYGFSGCRLCVAWIREAPGVASGPCGYPVRPCCAWRRSVSGYR